MKMIDFNRITTPTLILDKQKTQRNIQRMAQKASDQGIRFRPHFKTHQSAVVGEWFRQAGTRMITVSSVQMAQYFASQGWLDITLAFTLNWRQIGEINRLAKEIRLGVLIESEETVAFLERYLDANLDVWLKIDSGAKRTGLAWDQPREAASLAHQVLSNPKLHLIGLLTHAGHTYRATSPQAVCEIYRESVSRMNHLQQALHRFGLPFLEVSAGDTPGCSLCDDLGCVDEIRPGNFVFYDATQFKLGTCSFEDVALIMAVPVVAKHPQRNEVVVYGGAIHLSKDFFIEDGVPKYGYICFLDNEKGWSNPIPGAYVSALSQEHGVIRFGEEGFDRVRIGELIGIIPAHSCLAVSQMGGYLCLDGEPINTFASG